MRLKPQEFLLRAGVALALALSVLLISSTQAGATTLLAVGVTPTTSADIPKLWRKVQGKLMEGYNFLCEEWEDQAEIEQYDIDWSTREITAPTDLEEDGGVASIPEGGWQAFATSPAPHEITFDFIQLDGRFSVTGLTRYIEQHNPAAQITSQIAYQGRKKLQAIAQWYSDAFYGYSTAVRAEVSGAYAAATSHTLTLTNGHGLSSITNAAYIARLFRKNRDRVALIRGGALVANGYGTVTDRNTATPSITVNWAGSITPAAGDQVVLANAMYDTAPTIAETDYNHSFVGLTEACLATSVHGISSATVPEWASSHNDSSGGRFTGIRYHRGADEINNRGGGTLNRIYLSQGVYRDMLDNYQSAVRYRDPFLLEADGEVKIRGVEFKKTRRVPPGFAIGMDKRAYRRLPNLIGKPSARPKWQEAEKVQNRDVHVMCLPFIGGTAVLNRANLAIWTGLAEQ